MNYFLLILIFLLCISLSFFTSREGATEPEVTEPEVTEPINSIFLKNNTNTTFDNYIGNNILKNDVSASSYIMRNQPDPNYNDVEKKIEENKTLIDFFKNTFRTYSI